MLLLTIVVLSLLHIGKTQTNVTNKAGTNMTDHHKIDSYVDLNSTESFKGIDINVTLTQLDNNTMENSSVSFQSTNLPNVFRTRKKQRNSSTAGVGTEQPTTVRSRDKTTLKSTLLAMKTTLTKKIHSKSHKEKVKTKQEMVMMNAVAVLILFGGTFILMGIAFLSSYLDAPKADNKKEKMSTNGHVPEMVKTIPR